MTTQNQHDKDPEPDNWALHEELGKEYARQREMRGGKSIHQLVAEANAPRFPRHRRPGRNRKERKS